MLQVVLIENVQNLGIVGDVVSVRPGYARNFLIPKGKALRAIKEHIEEAQKVREVLLCKISQDRQTAVSKKIKLDGLKIIVCERVTEKGVLYGSVGTKEIIAALSEQHSVDATHDQLTLPHEPIKSVGAHPISLCLYEEIEANIVLEVRDVEESAGAEDQGEEDKMAEMTKQEGGENIAEESDGPLETT